MRLLALCFRPECGLCLRPAGGVCHRPEGGVCLHLADGVYLRPEDGVCLRHEGGVCLLPADGFCLRPEGGVYLRFADGVCLHPVGLSCLHPGDHCEYQEQERTLDPARRRQVMSNNSPFLTVNDVIDENGSISLYKYKSLKLVYHHYSKKQIQKHFVLF